MNLIYELYDLKGKGAYRSDVIQKAIDRIQELERKLSKLELVASAARAYFDAPHDFNVQVALENALDEFR